MANTLPFDPSVQYVAAGATLSSQSLAAGGNVSFVADFSSNQLGGWVGVIGTGGSAVAGTSGLQVQILAATDTTNYGAYQGPYVVPMVVSTATPYPIGPLPMGKFKVTLSNLDSTNAITVSGAANPIG